jgi:hypothetical protein
VSRNAAGVGHLGRVGERGRFRAWLQRAGIIGLTLAIVILGLPRPGATQAVSCDLIPTAGPYGYRLRGDRCEGLYEKQVGGTPLSIVSLTEFFEDRSTTSGTPLLVEWVPPSNSDFRLRAEGIRRKLYYRMESRRPADSRSYEWPSDVLAALNIKLDQIGILGWTRYSLGGVERDVHVPLQVKRKGASAQCATYVLVLFPGVELEELYVSLASLGEAGEPVRWLRRDQPLLYGYYPAETAIKVRLKELAAPGLYQLAISAKLASGGSTALTRWIYHGGGGLAPCND